MATTEEVENEYTSVLGQLSKQYQDITQQQVILQQTQNEYAMLQSRVNLLTRLQQQGVQQIVNSQGKQVSLARSLQALQAMLLDKESEYVNELSSLTKIISDRVAVEEEAYKINQQLNDATFRSAMQFNRVGGAVLSTEEQLKLFNSNVPGVKMLMLGEILMQVGTALTSLRDTIYKVQRDLGTTFATALGTFTGDLTQVVASYFREGPALAVGETRDAIQAFQQEFGTILTTGEAGRIAQQAKALGASAIDFVRAQRAFLGAGGVAGAVVTQQTFIREFRAAGLTANQALVFAAKNANLVAIAGVKYADALARAAANAQRIGVGIEKTEALADGLVGDFEGALERFSELRALGVEVDFNRLAGVAATGTPEEIVKELSSQLGGNKALLEEVQRNRFLKVAIERDLGLSIADVKRLAGIAQEPEAQTQEEANQESLTTISKFLPVIAKSLGALITVIGVAKGAQIGASFGPAIGAALGSVIAPGVGTAIGAAIGGGLAFGATKLIPGDDVISQPGYGSRMLMTESGTIALNNRDTIIAGTQLLSDGQLKMPDLSKTMMVNKPVDVDASVRQLPSAGELQMSKTPTPPQASQTNVNVDMSKLEAKLDRLASAFTGIKIEMDGNTVGRVSLNARSPLDRLSVAG